MKKLALFLVLALSGLAFRFIDESPIQTIVTQLSKYINTYPSEKVYLHTDKPYYAAGDTLWLKAYLVDALLNQADSASRVVYVNFVDDKGMVLEKRTFRVDGGYSSGEIALPTNLAKGNYQLVAYTNWMRNFSEDFFFKKTVSIVSDRDSPSAVAEEKKIDLQFFPEGGDMVAGLRSLIAFKAIDENGKGVDCEGVIVDEKGDKVSEFKSENIGMGSFLFFPKAGKEYSAIAKAGTEKVTVALPKAKENGFTLSVDNLPANFKVNISKGKTTEAQNLFLVVHARGQMRFINDVPQNYGTAFYIDKNKIQDEGIITFTLFDAKMKPIAERLVLNFPERKLKITATPDKAEYAPREKVTMNITATDFDGKPVAADLSMAVTDGGQVSEKTFADNILSNLLLTSDLQGYIENPAYYFDTQNPNAVKHLDNLMLTQGWRRFTWNDVFKKELVATQFLPEQGISLSGKILQPDKKEYPNLSFTMMVSSLGGANKILAGATDKSGAFAFAGVDFVGRANLTLKTNKDKRQLEILLNNLSTPDFKKNGISAINIPTFSKDNVTQYLNNFNNAIKNGKMLNSVEVVTGVTKKEVKDSRRSLYGTPDYTLVVDEKLSSSFNSVLAMIKGRIAGVDIVGDNITFKSSAGFTSGAEPLFLVNGSPTDKSTIISLNPRDVEAVDAIRGSNAATLGSRGSNGVIAILLKKSGGLSDDTKTVAGGASRFAVGYSPTREFYVPKYTNAQATVADFRSTIYWNPAIITDANGKASVVFYNSDSKATMNVNLQGSIPKGRFGATKVSFKALGK